MATTLANIRTLISDEISRGTQLDSKIDARVRMAIQFFERNYNMSYMFTSTNLSLASGASSVSAPARVKRFELLRYADSDGVYYPLQKVDPQDIYDNTGTYPTGWWITNADTIYFDTTTAEALTIETVFYQNSTLPTVDADEHWLFDYGQDFIIAQTMKFLAPMAREPDWIGLYKDMRSEAIKTLLDADSEFVQGGQSPMMLYKGGN